MSNVRTGLAGVGRLFKLAGLVLVLILSASSQQPDPLDISVYVPSTSNKVTLTKDDFEVRLDGQVAEVISAEKSTQPLKIVLLLVTQWAGCMDSFAPFSSLDEIDQVFGGEDQVAIVLSDGGGTVIRDLSKPGISLSSDLTDAIRVASRNSHEDLNLESGIYESKPGLTFPMKGLQASLGLLSRSSGAGDKVIVLVNDLKNSVEGTWEESRNALSTMVEQKVSISWLTTRELGDRFSLAGFPYGRRDFFFGLPDLSGGEVKNCRERNSSLENNVKDILVRHRDRYRLQLLRNQTSGQSLRSVAVTLKKVGHPGVSLTYPKAIFVE
jgi:hypothetical protein